MSLHKTSRTHRWTDLSAATMIDTVRNELVEKFGTEKHPDRLPYIQQTISETAEASDPDTQLRAMVLVISALIWNLREGFTAGIDHTKLIELGRSLLRDNGVPVEGSKISYLHGYLRDMESEHARHFGENWRSFWLSTLASRSTLTNTHTQHIDSLTTASRLFRLGQLAAAENTYNELLMETKDTELKNRAALDLARIHRLRGDYELFESALASINSSQLTSEQLLDLEFERLLAESTQSGDFRPVMAAVRNGKSHHKPVFVIESVLWANAARGSQAMDMAYSLRSLAKNSPLRPQEAGTFFECAVAIAEIGEKEIAVSQRLEQLGSALSDIGRMTSVDKELLVLVAAARALARSRFWQLASTCLREYEALSRKVSGNRTGDIFGIAQDMFDANWFQAPIIGNSKAA